MDAKKAIFNRRTIHFFENKKVNENIIRDSIEAVSYTHLRAHETS